MFVRFFGGSNCRECLELFVILNKLNVDFEYVDAFDDDTQDFCDEHNVDKLPHIQFVEDEDVIIEHAGSIDEDEFTQYLISHFPNY